MSETQAATETEAVTATATAPGWRSPDVIPTLRYRDAHAAIDWLVDVFGFRRHAVYDNGQDPSIVDHAELRFGSGLVMIGSDRADNPYPAASPARAGAITGGLYVVVDDPDAHHARSTAAGAEILRELSDMDYGSREYSVRDPEGYVWTFGTYRPAAPGD